MALNLIPPSRQTGTTDDKLNGLYSYLYQLVETLNVSMNGGNTQQTVLHKAGGGNAAGSTSSAVPETTTQEYQQVKALIIKTATEVTGSIRKLVTEIAQEYTAQSEFGTYSEFLKNKISQSAEGFMFEWDAEERISTTVASFDDYLAQSSVYLRLGIVIHNKDGTVESGIIVGKNFQKVTVDDKEYYTSGAMFALLTAEEISFWQGDPKTGSNTKRSSLSWEKLKTANAFIENLEANNINAEVLAATLAKVKELKVDDLDATNAFIENLNAQGIDADRLAAISAQIVDLYSVKIISDLIEAGKITTDMLAAKAVTAEKIDVANLFADQATVNALNAVDISGNESLRLFVNNLPIIHVFNAQTATDECLADQAVRVYSEYLYTQAGSGTAAPNNVRVIEGYTSTKLVRCGKNIADMSAMTTGQSDVVLEHSPDTLRVYTTANKAYASAKSDVIRLRKGVRYSLSASVTALVSGDVRVCMRKEDGNVLSGTTINFSAAGSASVSFTPGSDVAAYVSPMVTWAAANGDATFANIQLEVADAATAYERYNGETYTSKFASPIFGGTLDWVTGKTTETWRHHSFDGTEGWKSTGTNLYYYLKVGGENYADSAAASVSSHFAKVNINSSNSNIGFNVVNSSAGEARVLVRPGISGVTNLAAWKNYLAAQAAAGTPVQVCFKLTVPEEVQPTTGHEVLCVEGLNTVYTDATDGRIEFGHDSLASHLQSQINLIPGQIRMAVSDGLDEATGYTDEQKQAILDILPEKIALNVSAGVKAGSSVTITKDEVSINSPTTTISIPVEGSEDGEEIVSIDEEGLRADRIAADEIYCPDLVYATPATTYTPANAAELLVLLDKLNNRCLRGNVIINADAVDGGSYTLRGIHGYGTLTINNGVMNKLTVNDCSSFIMVVGTSLDSSETAVNVKNSRLYLRSVDFNAEEGLYAYYFANVTLNNCTGKCNTLLRSASGSAVSVTGTTCPKGLPGSITAELYSSMEFVAADSAPTVTEVTTTSIAANSTRTWGGSWLSTGTYGTALYQGTTGDGALRMGCMWFPLTAISGKTIVSATLTLKRVSGIGGGGSVAVGIYGTTTASASGTPARGTKYAEISLANGETGSVDVTNAVKALANGSIKGLMIYNGETGKYHGKTYTYGYAKIYGTGAGVPTLSVTYK